MSLLTKATGMVTGARGATDEERHQPEVHASSPSVIAPDSELLATSQADNTWRGRPGPLGDAFLGREDELKEIARGFRSVRGVVIGGGAGVGKTRLAAEFAHRSGAPGFWTAAGATADETLAALAPSLFVPEKGRNESQIADEVRRLLEAFPGTTLWVIDNMAKPEQLERILASCGQVRPLITLRPGVNADSADGFIYIDIESPARPAALTLLCSRSDVSEDDPAAGELVDVVGRTPIALELLSGRMAADDRSPAELVAELKKTAAPADSGVFPDDESGHGDRVLAAACASVLALPARARRCLAPLAYCGDAVISKGLISTLTGDEDDGLAAVLRTCARRSILTWHDGTVRIHPVVTAAIAASSASDAGKKSFRKVLKRHAVDPLAVTLSRARARLAAHNRDQHTDIRMDVPHYQRILEWVRTRDGDVPGMLEFVNELAVAYHALGRAEPALALTEETLEARSETLGPEHPETIAARNNLAAAYQAAGRIDESIAVHERTLAESERALGPDHPTTTASRQNLASAHRIAGRVSQAVPFYEEAVASREKLLGPEHPDTLASRNMLASAYQATGDVHKALPIYEKTLELRERILGPNHPDTLATRSNLATAYQTTGRLADALDMYKQALDAKVQLFGPEDRRTLTTRNNMATALHSDGRLRRAMEMYEETLDSRLRTLGDENAGTMTSRNNLASAHRATGNLRDALMIYERNVEDRRRILGPEHPKTLTSMSNVATVRGEIGNVEEAIPAFEEVLAVAERVLGRHHPITANCVTNLAAAYRVMGRTRDASELEGVPQDDPDR